MSELKKLKETLSTEFEMKDLGPAKKILGMTIQRDRNLGRLTLSKEEYLHKVLMIYCMDQVKSVSTPLGAHFKLRASKEQEDTDYSFMDTVPYSNAVGSIMYAMIGTRPDLAHPVGVICRFMSNPNREHWDAVRWVLRYIKGTQNYKLVYTRDASFKVKGFCDSDFAADLAKRRSITGFIFTVGGNVVSWKSSLQHAVALSTTEAEYVALAEAVKEAVWLKGIVEELGLKPDCAEVFCDSQSALALSKNQVFHERTKHIDLRLHFVGHIIAQGRVKVLKVHTQCNLADILT